MPKMKNAVRGKTAAGKKTAKRSTANKKTVVKKAAGMKKKTTNKKAVKKSLSLKNKTTTAKNKTANRKMGKVYKIEKQTKTTKEKFIPYQAKRGEEYMGVAQSAHFRAILLNWKKELMEEVDRTVHHMRDEASNFPDPNDRATQEEEFTLELRTRDRERKLINKIDEALTSLDNTEYGYCEICGVEIGIRRLEARPTATLCIDCKTLDEIKERHLG
ncbi:MAG: polymerase-binding transcription factor DksA [Gammaproteobacteria bacterium]|nr:polymerase-binding transcription factor DksA [Gammaproteobacteria bacterium]